ncbi:MAG: hypothetical protein PHS53_01570 [Candidatus Pacebacteria bacterium]|nr:hypothetical protein [Candidatus Paceibacterota bacterium]MDD5356818.1 hypothetical protein [Candidatus Paceibacterota bacterium]
MIIYLDHQIDALAEITKDNTVTKVAFKDTDWVSVIREIGVKNDLNLSQLGVIYDLINQIILGQLNAGDFTGKLKKIAKDEDWDELDDGKISSVVSALNEKIFLPIRDAMRKLSGTKQEEDVSALKKEDVLHGIENPVKTAHLLSVEKTPVPPAVIKLTPATPTPAVTPSQPPVPTPQPPQPTPPPIVKPTSIEIKPHMDIMEAKLSSAVKMPVTEVKVAEKPPVTPAPPRPAAPTKYTTDPYREPPKA